MPTRRRRKHDAHRQTKTPPARPNVRAERAEARAQHDDAQRAGFAASPSQRVTALALVIAAHATRRHKADAPPVAELRWKLIQELRQAFDDAHIDWRSHRVPPAD